MNEEVQVGDLVVHIGAKPNGFRIRLVCAIGEQFHQDSATNIYPRETVIFVDGRYDWKNMWRVFNGWKDYERR